MCDYNVFNVWPKTALLPVWPRDAKKLDSPGKRSRWDYQAKPGELKEFNSCYGQHKAPSLEIWLRNACKGWAWVLRKRLDTGAWELEAQHGDCSTP